MLYELTIIKLSKVYEQLRYNEVAVIENKENNIEVMKKSESKENEVEETKEYIWQVEIPEINLIAPISEGTSQEVMLEFVGHFENTSKMFGNVGLAAHNRGYPINYFSRLKELEIGDEIIYKTNIETKTYSIETIVIIEDTDWSYLQETIDNRITLITCVANEPTKRLCVQGLEI